MQAFQRHTVGIGRDHVRVEIDVAVTDLDSAEKEFHELDPLLHTLFRRRFVRKRPLAHLLTGLW